MTYSKEVHKYLVKKLGKNYHNYPKCVKYYLSPVSYTHLTLPTNREV